VNPPGMIVLHAKAARRLAVAVLLAEPEALGDDVLESCLLRDRHEGKDTEEESRQSMTSAARPGPSTYTC
jgi:hypothetical protein